MKTESVEVDAYTIPQFCNRHSISRATFYKIQKEGNAPKIFYCGKKPLVSIEAAREWRAVREMEQLCRKPNKPSPENRPGLIA